MPTTERISVKIPPGVDTGSKIRVAGKGEAGRSGAPAGDLYILTKVRPHPLYERKGDNLYIERPHHGDRGGIGRIVEVQTLDGPVMMKFRPPPRAGRRSVSLASMPHLKGEGRGDQFVQVRIVLPKNLDERSQQLLRDFERLNPYNPRMERL
jgi:DnaJ-class molecular chaperone